MKAVIANDNDNSISINNNKTDNNNTSKSAIKQDERKSSVMVSNVLVGDRCYTARAGFKL